MIERVAVAIIEAAEKGARGKPREIARAAIEAMREPTEAMIDAADPFELPREIWPAMIDAALSERSGQ